MPNRRLSVCRPPGIVENAPRGSVVATLSALDADGDAVTYSLAGGSPFAIVGNSLVVDGTLDFEAARQHSVVIQARDSYGGVTSQTFTIAVGNAVEGTPFVLRGGGGADVFQGEAGGDTIYGGAGNDTLYGGAGKDVFVFNTGTRTNERGLPSRTSSSRTTASGSTMRSSRPSAARAASPDPRSSDRMPSR